MTEVLVLVDHVDGEIKKSTLELLTAARGLGEPSAVVVGPNGTIECLRAALRAHGAAKVYVAETNSADFLTPQVEVLAGLIGSKDPMAVLIGVSADGKEIAGRLAVKTDSALLIDVVAIRSSDGISATHSVFGGTFIAETKSNTAHPIVTLRPGSVEVEPAGRVAAEEIIEVPSGAGRSAQVQSHEPVIVGDRPELTDASVIVSGGRGVGSAEQFTVVEDLADSLGAAVGASRAAVDAGFYPHQYQVGQTGKTVSPQLYIALGISGAIQHRAGMQTSKTIVAVNKDPEAPIFDIADFGVVGDLFTVAPQLQKEITTRTSS